MNKKHLLFVIPLVIVGIILISSYGLNESKTTVQVLPKLQTVQVLDEAQQAEPLEQIGNDTRPIDPPPVDTTQIAHQIFDLVNQERTNAGVRPLVWNEQITQSALGHNLDMKNQNYVEHISPEGVSPAQRGIIAGFRLCGDPQTIALDNELTITKTQYENLLAEYNSKVDKYEKDSFYYKNFGSDNIGLAGSLKLDYDHIQQMESELRQMNQDYNQEVLTYNQEGKLMNGFGENIARLVGHSSDQIPILSVQGWLNSPGHKEIMLLPYWTMTGLAVSYDPVIDEYLITNDFC